MLNHTRTPAPFRRGFSVIEGAVVIGIIALLAAVLFVALRTARGTGDLAAERAYVSSLKLAVLQFKEQHGFIPPLVVDGPPIPTTASGTPPIDTNDDPMVWSAPDLANHLSNVNNGNRFSIFSLPYYIYGALGKDFDGAEGPGYTEPNKSGKFARRGRVFDALMDTAKDKTKRGAPRLFFANPASNARADKIVPVLLDYWSAAVAGGDGQLAIRYYRWIPEYVSAAGPDKGQVDFYNMPSAVIDPKFVNVSKAQRQSNPQQFPEPSVELRDKQFAIVSAGPNRLFGDEDVAIIRARLALDSSVPEPAAREQAARDNIVEVGP